MSKETKELPFTTLGLKSYSRGCRHRPAANLNGKEAGDCQRCLRKRGSRRRSRRLRFDHIKGPQEIPNIPIAEIPKGIIQERLEKGSLRLMVGRRNLRLAA